MAVQTSRGAAEYSVLGSSASSRASCMMRLTAASVSQRSVLWVWRSADSDTKLARVVLVEHARDGHVERRGRWRWWASRGDTIRLFHLFPDQATWSSGFFFVSARLAPTTLLTGFHLSPFVCFRFKTSKIEFVKRRLWLEPIAISNPPCKSKNSRFAPRRVRSPLAAPATHFCPF